MIQLTGLWLNESSSGQKYMAGYFGKAKVLIFRNQYKDNESQPDYILYVAEPEKKNIQEDGLEPPF